MTVQVIRTGITRTVWLVGPWAIKVPSLRGGSLGGSTLRGLAWSISRGIQANISEWEFSQWEDYHQAVCRPRWCLAGIISVYARCTPLTFEQYTSGALPDIPFPDKKIENAGMLPGGRLVWIDYDNSWNGCPHTPIVIPERDHAD